MTPHLSEAVAVDGGEYLVLRTPSTHIPGYVPVGAVESRWALHDWARRLDRSRLAELAALCSSRSGDLDDGLRARIDTLVTRMDDCTTELAIYRRVREPATLEWSPLEDAVDLVAAMDRVGARERAANDAGPVVTTFVALRLVDQAGRPVARKRFVVRDARGAEHRGKTDGDGAARIDGLAPGQCEISFPKLEKKVERKQAR